MPFKMVILALFSVAFQFGLAILRWGGFAAFFAHPALVALAIVTLVLTFAAFFPAENSAPASRKIVANDGSLSPSPSSLS
jgi:fumarate reductase subunit C